MKTNWQTKKLGDICIVGAGNSAPQKKEFFIDGKYPFFRTSDVGVVHVGKISKSTDYLNDKGIKGMRLFRKNTILFPKSGASTFLNHRVIMGIDGYVSSHLATINTDDSVLSSDYIFYFLQEIKAQDLIQDHKYPSLNLPVIERIEISYPESLLEQKRIVKTLDEVFEKVAKAKEAAEKNLQNSKELFESYLQSVFANPGKDWEEKCLSDITSKLGDGLHGTPKYTEDGEYYFINGNNLNDGKIEIKDRTKRVSTGEYQKHKKDLNEKTILVSINGTLGNVAFYNGEKVILGKSACYFNLKDGVDKYFIKFVISGPYFLKYAHREATGATIKNVSLKSMREFKVPLPSLAEQKRIVKKLNTLSEETKKLGKIYEQKLADLEELKKSILSKAFHAEL